MKIMIPLILSERNPCAETILNRFLQDHIFNEQRNAAVVAVQKFHLVVRVEQFGGDLHLNAVGGVDAAALHAADARRGHGHGLFRRFQHITLFHIIIKRHGGKGIFLFQLLTHLLDGYLIVVVCGVQIILCCGFGMFGVFLTLVMDAAVLLLLLREASGRKQIEHGLKEIAAGDLDYKIDLTELQGEDNLQLAGIVNSLGEGMKAAVQEQMKSERLKADLITNVSHDIKTPLTSIINYVDLLKRENIENEKAKDYIRVLDEKSQRLKQLTEDLVEASKISSGNIKLEFMNLNLNELVQQVNGEFAERFEGRNLDLICILQPEPLLIRADSRRIWRVLENLYVNVCKYAMPGTRVYVDAIKKDGKIQLSIKNISENPLNFQADELTERFIRGDVSRSTEGSGLGLSIAKNLTVLQHGSFNIYLDGDLFKVTITFDEAVKEKKPMPPMIVPEAVQEEAQQDA